MCCNFFILRDTTRLEKSGGGGGVFAGARVAAGRLGEGVGQVRGIRLVSPLDFRVFKRGCWAPRKQQIRCNLLSTEYRRTVAKLLTVLGLGYGKNSGFA